MKITKGKVVSGQVVVEGDALEEGTTVTILAPEANETFELNPEDEAALLAAIAEADRGDVISAEELLDELSGRG